MKWLVFVGQGPNREAWEHGLETGARLRPADRESFAEDYCRRVAITGSVGLRLAQILDLPIERFRSSFARRNLNARWNGKKGKGDEFDRAEAKAAAELVDAEGFNRFVLLGEEVSRAFGFKFSALEIRTRPHDPRRYLCFPHPSGINQWWNDSFNRFRAAKRLREFIDPCQHV
jgi:hypothetical protein